jgi:HEPN domain-containing protein
MMRRGKTVAGERAEATHHLSKAQQFLDVAKASLRDQLSDATMLNAIHAGISAADAVTIAVAGERSADPDHQRAVNLLEEVAGASEVVRNRARQLRMLIQKKNAVEYESRRASRDEAAQAVERAERLVAWAQDAVESGSL